MIVRPNIDEWPKWNDYIFREERDAVVFCAPKGPMQKEIESYLREKLQDIRVISLIPKDYKKIFSEAEEYVEPPALLFFSKGQCVGRNTCMLFESEDKAWNKFMVQTLIDTFLKGGKKNAVDE